MSGGFETDVGRIKSPIRRIDARRRKSGVSLSTHAIYTKQQGGNIKEKSEMSQNGVC